MPRKGRPVFTNGVCSGNGYVGAKGGSGVWFEPKWLRHLNVSERLPAPADSEDGDLGQTNNRAELWAIIRAIEQAPPHITLIVKTDSKYAVLSLNSWIHKWKSNGWINCHGKAVANQDLIKRCDNTIACRRGRTIVTWVPGRAGIYGNDRARDLARAAL
ncbi:unnamed protein product [Jaminaea pallidilutea]